MTLGHLALLAANAAACAVRPWFLAALAALERWGDGDTAALLASVARARRRT